MQINEIYQRFLMMINQNITDNNLSMDKPRFVYSYNDAETRFVDYTLEKRNEDDIRDISALLEVQKPLTKITDKAKFSSFEKPKDYFDLGNLFVTAKQEKCMADDFKVWEVKTENIGELYEDPNNEPSFEWRETFYHESNRSFDIYTKGFNIQKANLTYYRYPRKVDIEGYVKQDNTQSQNITSELPDRVILKVLTAMTREFQSNTGDVNGFQMSSQKFKSEI